MYLTIEAFGEQEMARKLLKLSDRAKDMRPGFDKVHEAFLRDEAKLFDSQGNGEWAPLAPTTLAYKQEHGLDTRIMFATGDLYNSLATAGDPNHIYEVTPQSMFIGSRIGYGVFHHSRKPRSSNLPRRPLVMLDEGTKRYWLGILQRFITQGLKTSGGEVL